MNQKIILAKNIIIFYILIGLPIMYISLDNVINGIILQKNSTVGLGVLSIGGFVLIPFIIYSTYRNSKCILSENSIKVGTNEYMFQYYDAKVISKEKKITERPLFSLFKKHYPHLIITKKDNNEVFLSQALNCFKNEIELLRNNLPKN